MKVKKQKKHRKIVTFYTSCFGLRKPFKVLCDGTFIHHLLANKITPADKALGNTLNATVKLYTTRCVLEELKRLGCTFSEALEAARQLIIARCEHQRCEHPVKCITEVIGESNSQHFFVASQDTELRKQLQQVPGVPLMFGLRNALYLEPPSAFQREYVKTSEEARSHMSDVEYQIFKDKLTNTSTGEEATNSPDEADEDKDLGDQTIDVKAVKKACIARRQMGVKDKPQFKRKKAKGPNPLSCKKKKRSHENQNSGPLKEKKEGNKRSRKRKRSRKQQNPVETNS